MRRWLLYELLDQHPKGHNTRDETDGAQDDVEGRKVHCEHWVASQEIGLERRRPVQCE